MSYAIMTDSVSDLTSQMARDWDVTVVPLGVAAGDSLYADEESSLPRAKFYAMLRQGVKASTCAVNSYQFQEAMKPILEGGQDILYVGMCATMSATYEAAQDAAEQLSAQFPNRRIAVVDSRCGTYAQALLVYLTVERRRQGAGLEEATQFVRETGGKICHWFALSDLQHLKRGGRISASSAVLGSLLQMKPLVHLTDNCQLVVANKIRGRKASIRALVNMVESRAVNPKKDPIFISHCDCPQDAQWLADALHQELGADNVLIGEMGPVIAVHGGPDALGVYFIGSPR